MKMFHTFQDVIFIVNIYALTENPIITEGQSRLASNLSAYVDTFFFPFLEESLSQSRKVL